MTSREELAARLGKIAANRGLPSEDRADLREAAQLIREARELEARVARVHELLSLLDSWNVNHGPLDDPLPGNLIVSMMNTIGDPRVHGGHAG